MEKLKERAYKVLTTGICPETGYELTDKDLENEFEDILEIIAKEQRKICADSSTLYPDHISKHIKERILNAESPLEKQKTMTKIFKTDDVRYVYELDELGKDIELHIFLNPDGIIMDLYDGDDCIDTFGQTPYELIDWLFPSISNK